MRSRRYLNSVRSALPENARANLDRAFGGDALAARRLMILAPRRLLGHIAFLAYQAKISNPAYREIVKAVWVKESRRLLTGHWRQQVVRRMLVRADFRIPKLRGPITIYRALGAQRGTTSSDELCWFSSRRKAEAESPRTGRRPKILQARIDPSEVIFWGNAHGEQEVVTRRPVPNATPVRRDAPLREQNTGFGARELG